MVPVAIRWGNLYRGALKHDDVSFPGVIHPRAHSQLENLRIHLLYSEPPIDESWTFCAFVAENCEWREAYDDAGERATDCFDFCPIWRTSACATINKTGAGIWHPR